jgi:NAD(P)-dependent dehydrogenase (short-subunit alcohol dehydrogenase family)
VDAFVDQTCVVTGGGWGIGKALSELLLECGARVFAFDINAEGLDSLDRAGHPARLHKVQVDVTDEAAVSDQLSSVVLENGSIDYLFNVAGITIAGEARDVVGGNDSLH